MLEPQRFVGLHFFNPVSRLPLVEVIRGRADSDEDTSEPSTVVCNTDRQATLCPVVVRPGFVVNRILAPVYARGATSARRRYRARDDRQGCRGIRYADRDRSNSPIESVWILRSPRYGDPRFKGARNRFAGEIEAGDLGAKTGRGFYEFENNRPQRRASDLSRPRDEELKDRLILALVNEAMACYEDGVVEELDLLDAGVIFGTGFAPFTGGPIHYARQARNRAT